MIVDTWATRGRGLCAVVLTVTVLLCAIPAGAQAALSIEASPANPRPREAVTFRAVGTCDPLCGASSWKVGAFNIIGATSWGPPEPATLEDGFAGTGTYNVTLTYARVSITPPWSIEVVKPITVVANRGPVAAFTTGPAAPVIGQAVTFTDTSTDPEGDPLTRAWDTDNDGAFDDGDGGTASRTFTTFGTKTARLRVRDSYGAESITTRTVTIANAAPTVTLSVTPTTVATGANVAFSAAASDPDGGPVTYAWDLDGDGAYDDATDPAPPARSYPRAGSRTIGVRVTDDDGDAASSTVQRTQVVTVTNRAPSTPTITPSPASVPRGDDVTLTAAATDPEGTALTYAWDLDDDGAYDDATGAAVTRAMPAGGTLAARVRATDADGGSTASAPFALAAANRAPTAAFSASTTTPAIGETVTFTDTSSDADGQALTRAWDLDGDGAYDDGTGASATFAFPVRGARTVRLRVSDGQDTATASRTLTVRNVAPTATLTVTPASAPTATAVSFSVTASDPDGGPLTYAWELDGDGDFDDFTGAAPPPRSYPRAGARTVGVRVTDDDGDPATSTTERTTTVTATNRLPAVPVITATPAPPQPGAPYELRAAATDPEGTALTYAWDLDADGAYDDGTGESVSRVFPATGDLVVRVRATDADGGAAASAPLTLVGAPAPPDPDPDPVPDPTPAPEPAPPTVTPAAVAPPAPVAPAPTPAAATPAAASTPTPAAPKRPASSRLRLMRPFPRVRIQGRVTRRGARFRRITVTAPRGSKVTVTCKGRGCPRKYAKTIGRSGAVRLTRFVRSYRAGTRIVIRVSRAGAIGKHTSILVRRRRAPKRTDRCLRPGATAPTRCPAN